MRCDGGRLCRVPFLLQSFMKGISLAQPSYVLQFNAKNIPLRLLYLNYSFDS